MTLAMIPMLDPQSCFCDNQTWLTECASFVFATRSHGDSRHFNYLALLAVGDGHLGPPGIETALHLLRSARIEIEMCRR